MASSRKIKSFPKLMLIFYIINLILLGAIIYAVYTYIGPQERNDISKINAEYNKLVENRNEECINYLQFVTSIPNWRISIITALIYTLVIIAIGVACGLYPTQPLHFGFYWGIFLSCTFLIYKLFGTVNFHYICENSCLPSWK